MKRWSALGALLLCTILAGPVAAKSVLSPRHSGTEPPGGPRQMEMPTMGGMSHTDAYGYSLTDRPYQDPKKAKRQHRPRPGAYGGHRPRPPEAALPEVKDNKALWKF